MLDYFKEETQQLVTDIIVIEVRKILKFETKKWWNYLIYRGNASILMFSESKWKKAWAPVDRLMQYLYFLLVRTLYLDTWLLSRATSLRGRWKGRRSRVLWLVLLPPLLFAGEFETNERRKMSWIRIFITSRKFISSSSYSSLRIRFEPFSKFFKLIHFEKFIFPNSIFNIFFELVELIVVTEKEKINFD